MKAIPTIITFTNPQILFGLFAIAIPIIIHLFNLRRVKKVQFSNTALLKRIKEESSAKRKPVELLILACRIISLSLIVLAFAQPLFKDQDNDLKLGSEVLIYLDNSLSLSGLTDNGATGFDVLVNEANSIVDSYPDGTIFHFMENSYSNSISADYTAGSLKELLTEVQQVGVDRNLEEITSRIRGSDFKGDIYYLSDFQNKTGFQTISQDTTNLYYVVPAIADDISNVYVDTVFLENTFLSGSFANLLKIRLQRNFRDNEVINLKLIIDGQLFGTAEIDFGNQLFAESEFELQSSVLGLDKIELEIDDPTLQFDNTFYASVNQLDKVRVVEIFDSTTPAFIEALFDSNDVFQFTRVDSRFLDNEVIASTNFLVINQVDELSNQLLNAAKGLLESGGTVMFIPDPKTEQADLTSLGINVSNENGEKLALTQPNFENPLYQGVFEEQDENIEMPQATVNYRVLNSELDYLSFRNGRGFLTKINTTGNLLFFSSPFNEENTSFTNHALFVPVMYKLALGSKVNLSNLYYYTDSESIFYPIDAVQTNTVFKLYSDSKELIPNQRLDGDRLILEIPKDVIEPGHYSLLANDQALGTLSFNIPDTESNLSSIEPKVFEDLSKLSHVTVIESAEQGDVRRFLEAGVAGIPLWKYALLGALFFLFVEIILIRYL